MANRIRIISIGKIKEKYLLDGIHEYQKRLDRFCRLEMIELKDEGLAREAERLEKYIGNNTYALDLKGKEYSSIEFASLLKQTDEIAFIIGGAEGLDEVVKIRCRLISLSRMTFIHEMCRLFLIEQIYRGFMINSNRQYHR